MTEEANQGSKEDSLEPPKDKKGGKVGLFGPEKEMARESEQADFFNHFSTYFLGKRFLLIRRYEKSQSAELSLRPTSHDSQRKIAFTRCRNFLSFSIWKKKRVAKLVPFASLRLS